MVCHLNEFESCLIGVPVFREEESINGWILFEICGNLPKSSESEGWFFTIIRYCRREVLAASLHQKQTRFRSPFFVSQQVK